MDVFSFADKFGPEKIICVHDTKTGMKGMLVIDNTARGPGKGGCRMAPDLTLSTLFRLARTMTWKWAMIDVFMGGAKAGIIADPADPKKEQIIRAYVRALKDYIPSRYIVGIDMGMAEEDVAIVIDELDDIGAATGTPAELGGIPIDKMGFTAYGLMNAVTKLAAYQDKKISSLRIVVQGLGAVGSWTARYLSEQGASIVGVSSRDGALYNPDGIDMQKLWDLKNEYGDKAIKAYPEGKQLPLGEELYIDCEVLVPSAKEDVITTKNMCEVKAKMIVEGANMPLSREAEEYFHSKGIFVLPDFVANAGGVVAGGTATDERLKAVRRDPNWLYDVVQEKIQKNTELLYNAFLTEPGLLPRDYAMKIAQERVVQAMKKRKRLPE